MNKAYSLVDDEVVERDATEQELSEAREKARTKLQKDPAGWAMRSCWNCNPAHRRFLEDTTDDFLFSCVMGCGRWYWNGIDITGEKGTS